MKQLYGDFGVDSEVGRLRSVLMRRPGKEIEGITDPAAVAMKEIWDVGKVREEHDALAEIYRSNGVEVHYIEEMAPHLPNDVYARDLVLMTPEGAIVARPAAGCRIGEEVYAARQLAKLGVPIIKTINGDGIFDGACCLWMDRKTCMLGYGKRCNPSAAAQVEEELRNMGVEHLIKVEIPRGMAHLDSFMAFADLKVALVLKIAAPDTIYRELEEREFNIVDIPDYDCLLYTSHLCFWRSRGNFCPVYRQRLILPSYSWQFSHPVSLIWYSRSLSKKSDRPGLPYLSIWCRFSLLSWRL